MQTDLSNRTTITHEPNHQGPKNNRTNSSNRQTGKTRVTNSQAATHENWLVRCSPRARGNQYIYMIYRKFPLIPTGCIQQPEDKFDALIFRGGGCRQALIFGRKNTSSCNLLNILLFFLFFIIKIVFWHILRHARCEICRKLTIKTPEYIQLTIKLTKNTPLTSLLSLYYII